MSPKPYELRDCPAFSYPKDFDAAAFRAFLKMADISPKRLSALDLLVNLEFAKHEDSHVVFNNAGVLFFAKNPVRFLSQSRVTCVVYETPKRVEILDRKDLEFGLLENARQAEVFLLQHLPTRYEFTGELRRKEHREIPADALREGILNALMHRDLTVLGANVFIEIDPTQVRISNPGGLPPGLSREAFGKKSVRRNPLIADMFHRVGMVERVGTGIRRIRDALAAAGCPEPKFEFTSFFDLVFPRRERPSSEQASGGSHRGSPGEVTGGVSPYAPVVLKFCKTPRTLREIMPKMGIRKWDNAAVHIRSLVKAGLLALTIPDRPRSRLQKYVTTHAGVECLKKR